MVDPRPLFDFINERHAIYLRKAALEGSSIPDWAAPAEPPPPPAEGGLTEDPILARYKFTNVFRELDRVTRWIAENIREPYADHGNLWFILAIARQLNWPPTLSYLMETPGAWPDGKGFRPENLTAALEARQASGAKVETAAYMVTAGGIRASRPWHGWTKQRYMAEVVLGKLWSDRDPWRARLTMARLTLPRMEDSWAKLVSLYEGWGAFIAYQLVLEWRHTRYLREAEDILTWAAVGPGSRRGLNRLCDRPVNHNLNQGRALQEMRELLAMSPECLAPWVPPLEMEDIQNSLCELDKYLRAKKGEGRPRSLYRPFRGWGG